LHFQNFHRHSVGMTPFNIVVGSRWLTKNCPCGYGLRLVVDQLGQAYCFATSFYCNIKNMYHWLGSPRCVSDWNNNKTKKLIRQLIQ